MTIVDFALSWPVLRLLQGCIVIFCAFIVVKLLQIRIERLRVSRKYLAILLPHLAGLKDRLATIVDRALVVEGLALTHASLRAGRRATASFAVENIGVETSAAATASLRLCGNTGDAPIQLGAAAVAALPPNQKTDPPVAIDFKLPRGTAPGDYEIEISIGKSKRAIALAVPQIDHGPPPDENWQPPKEKYEVFVSFSRDMEDTAKVITDCVEEIEGLKAFNFLHVDPDREEIRGQRPNVKRNWQDWIGAPHEHGAKLVVVLLGERVGMEMQEDFGQTARAQKFHQRLTRLNLRSWIHIPGIDEDDFDDEDMRDTRIPLTGLAYELLETVMDHMDKTARGIQEHRKLLICVRGTRGHPIERNPDESWQLRQTRKGAAGRDGLSQLEWDWQCLQQRRWVDLLFTNLFGSLGERSEVLWLGNKSLLLAERIREILGEVCSGEDASLKIEDLPGPAPYDLKHARHFFAMEEEKRMLWKAVESQTSARGVICVHGRSGMGKSSLVRAGLWSRLTSEAARSDGYGAIFLDLDSFGAADDPFERLARVLTEGRYKRGTGQDRWAGQVLDQAGLRKVFTYLLARDDEKAISLLNLCLNDTTARGPLCLVLIIDHFDTGQHRAETSDRWRAFCDFVSFLGAPPSSGEFDRPTPANGLRVTSVVTCLDPLERGVNLRHVPMERTPIFQRLYERLFEELELERLQKFERAPVAAELSRQCHVLSQQTSEPVLPFVSMGLRRLHKAMQDENMYGWNNATDRVLDLCDVGTAIEKEGEAISQTIDQLNSRQTEPTTTEPARGGTIAILRNRLTPAEVAFREVMRRTTTLVEKRPSHRAEVLVPIKIGGCVLSFFPEFETFGVSADEEPETAVSKRMLESRFLLDREAGMMSLSHRQVLKSWSRAKSWLDNEGGDLDLIRQLQEALEECGLGTESSDTQAAAWREAIATKLRSIGEGGRGMRRPEFVGSDPLQIAQWRLCDLFARRQHYGNERVLAFLKECILLAVEMDPELEGRVIDVAASIGDAELVGKLARSKKDADATGSKNVATAAHFAAQYGHKNVLEQLKELKVNLNMPTEGTGFRPIHLAAQHDNQEAFEFLMNQPGIDIDAMTETGATPLHLASGIGYDVIAKKAIEKGAEPDSYSPTSDDWARPLHLAAQNGHANIVKMLVGRVKDPNAKTKNGFTALHLAIREGHDNCVAVLLEHAPAVSAHEPFPDETSTLNYALTRKLSNDKNRQKIVALLRAQHVKSKPDVVMLDKALAVEQPSGLFAELLGSVASVDIPAILRKAVEERRMNLISALARAGQSVRACDNGTIPFVVAAAISGDTPLLRVLLETDVDWQAADGAGWTGVHHAARLDQSRIARLLIDRSQKSASEGAGFLASRTRDGATALEVAIEYDRVEIAEYLVRSGAPIDAACVEKIFKDGKRDLFDALLRVSDVQLRAAVVRSAVHAGDVALVRALVVAGIGFRDAEHAEQSLLAEAVERGEPGLVAAVLNSDIDRNRRDSKGLAPLHHAVLVDNSEIAGLLIAKKVDINGVAKDGSTPLHIAAQRDQIGIVRQLLEAGCDREIFDGKGFTAGDIADVKGYTQIWSLIYPLYEGSVVRAQVHGDRGPPVNRWNVFLRFGNGALGKVLHGDIDGELAGLSSDETVSFGAAQGNFFEGKRVYVRIKGTSFDRYGNPAWDAVMRIEDQRLI